MHDDLADVNAFVAHLEGIEDVNSACKAIGRYASERRISELVELRRAIEAGCHVDGELRWPYEAVADRIEEDLARLPDAKSLDALLTMIAQPRVRSVRPPRPYLPARDHHLRSLAPLLAERRRPAQLVEVLGRPASTEVQELLACWMHQAILRGASLESESAALAFRAALADRGHPLAWLPLTRLDLERDAAHRMRHSLGANDNLPAIEPEVLPPDPPAVAGPFGDIVRVADDAEQRMQEVLHDWTEGSNGRSEAKVFRIEPIARSTGSIAPSEALLRALPLDCLTGAASIESTRVGARTVWTHLFGAAACGGAYTRGLEAAYGRPAAWRSLGALVGAPADATPFEIQAASRACSFATFMASNPWFYSVAWDLGIVAVRPDGVTVAVLAASDTD